MRNKYSQRELKQAFEVLARAVVRTRPEQFKGEYYGRIQRPMVTWWHNRKRYCFDLHAYGGYDVDTAWRLAAPYPPLFYAFELSFAAEELPLIVAGDDLVRFVESIFNCLRGDRDLSQVYQWPLFAQGDSYPHYAWTRLASRQTERAFAKACQKDPYYRTRKEVQTR